MIQLNLTEEQVKEVLKDYLVRKQQNIPFEKVSAEVKINCDGYYPYCSNCKQEIEGPIKNFCPTCGASFKEGGI